MLMRGERIGIIAEGREDQGVLKNILRAFGFDGSEIKLIRPSLGKDATDRHSDEQEKAENLSIGTFQGVKNACLGNEEEKRPDFEYAFSTLDCSNLVIHLDTAEIGKQDFVFKIPEKAGNENYSSELRNGVIELINHWLDGKYENQLFYAIAIEEIESWVLTAFEKKDTTSFANPKQRLAKYCEKADLNYKKFRLNPIKQKDLFFEELTKAKKFHKKKELQKFSKNNQSLALFVESLKNKFVEARESNS